MSELKIKDTLIAIKAILESYTVGELRLVEDMAQHIRIRKQDESLKQLMKA